MDFVKGCAPQMPCLRPSDAVPAPLRCRACAPQMPCLFSSPTERPTGSQVLLLALARHGPDMDELVPDLKRLDRANASRSRNAWVRFSLNLLSRLVWLPLSLCRYSTLSG